jgi:hypothetical protein
MSLKKINLGIDIYLLMLGKQLGRLSSKASSSAFSTASLCSTKYA